jgi:hypothetical protein
VNTDACCAPAQEGLPLNLRNRSAVSTNHSLNFEHSIRNGAQLSPMFDIIKKTGLFLPNSFSSSTMPNTSRDRDVLTIKPSAEAQVSKRKPRGRKTNLKRETSNQVFPYPKRNVGNNRYGSRGCLSCFACRKRRGKVWHIFGYS